MTAQTHHGEKVHVDAYISARFSRARSDLRSGALWLSRGLIVAAVIGVGAVLSDAVTGFSLYGGWVGFVAGYFAACLVADVAAAAGAVHQALRDMRLTRREAVEALRDEIRIVQVRSDLPAGMTCVEDIAEARGLRWAWGGGR